MVVAEEKFARIYPDLRTGWNELQAVHLKIQQYRLAHPQVFDYEKTVLGQALFDALQQSVNDILARKDGSLPPKDTVETAIAAGDAYNRRYLFEPGILASAILPDDFEQVFAKSAIHVAKNKVAFGVCANLEDIIRLVAPGSRQRGA